MKRIRIVTENPWEKAFGFARLVRSGSFAAVSGTVASDALGAPLADDPYGQTRAVLGKISDALEQAGASLADVVRLRVYFVDPGIASSFMKALDEAFPEGAPALTTVRVASLVSEAFHVEIEADAVVRPEREDDLPLAWNEPSD